MNERIEQLAEQAGMRHPVMGEVCYVDFNHKKFAELLVKECSKVILDEMAKCPNTKEWVDWVNGMDEAQAAIKVHFGVEE